MKLIVAQGNPGNQYNFTRHNFGFLAVDFFCVKKGIEFSKTPKMNALVAETAIKGEKTFIIKPQGFYNCTGLPTASFMNFYKIPRENLLVLADDFNLPFGAIRYRERGSAGGNNGLKSIISSLGSEDFRRLRLGTGNDELRHRLGDVDFVLSKFTPAEKDQLPAILTEVFNKIDNWSF